MWLYHEGVDILMNSAVVCAVEALAELVVGKSLQEIVGDFRGFYRLLTSDGQLRWVSLHSELSKDYCLDASFILFAERWNRNFLLPTVGS